MSLALKSPRHSTPVALNGMRYMANFVSIDEATFERLQARSQKALVLPHAIKASFDRRSHKVRIILSTGIELAFDPSLAPDLDEVSDDELSDVIVEGAGGSIHFPALDVDLSISRLLEGFLGPLDWARRERRAAASRENGKLGGRPAKAKVDA